MNIAVASRPGLSGLACLAAIARFHGLDVSEPYLLQVASPGRDGRVAPANLVQVATKVGLSAKLAKMSWRRLAGLGQALPAILPLRDGESVIFSGLKEDEAGGLQVVVRDLRDSKQGFLFWDRATLEANWNGQVLFVKRKYGLTDAAQPFGLRWFIPEFLRQKRAFGDVVIAALTLHVLALAGPIFFQLMIDRVVVHRVEATLIVLTIGVVLALLFEGALNYARGMILLYATSKIDIRLATTIFRKMISLPVDFFERNLAGVISKHMQQDQRIREFLSGRLLFTLLDATALFVFLPILIFYSWRLTLVVLFCASLIAAIIGVLSATFRRRLTDLYRAEGERQAMLVEAIHGINTVKALGLEPMQSRAWDQSSAFAIERRIEVGRVSTVARAASQTIEKAMLIAVIVVGVQSIFAGTLTVGALVAFQMLAGRVTGPLVQITALINEFQEVLLSVRMLGNIMNATSEPGMSRGLRPAIRGKVTFEDVSFNYGSSPIAALDRISFSIEPGQVVGVVGRSGSGKSTVMRLLQGLYAVQRGLVRIDDYDIRELDKVHLRNHMAVVLPESFLFRGTIRDNIAAGKTGASFEEVAWAARQAGAEEFVERLPQGYDTPLEEGGSNLSSGQRQRLAIARALVRRPTLLLLDEATSALDPESEMIVQDNMSRIVEGKTTIVVSHRLSSLRNCDTIMVFDKGQIVGNGPHDNLLASCLTYRLLWDKQSRSFR
ncbi:MAG TPA: peptidase domain-containing ABC transporter [Xanthobacteraceae bacterium]|nr:peptidase domain-containing ABC transporter [Xanthobacteraceae bacterium]